VFEGVDSECPTKGRGEGEGLPAEPRPADGASNLLVRVTREGVNSLVDKGLAGSVEV
jgi:hypothetical protein